jgi:hypothetical protein
VSLPRYFGGGVLAIDQNLVNWLLNGDVSVQYQTHRDLLASGRPTLEALQQRIAQEGWGVRFLACRRPEGHWGRAYYQPKWTCSHYTLLDLKNLGLSPGQAEVLETLKQVFSREKGKDGGINPFVTVKESDVCLNGMALSCAAYFGSGQEVLGSVIDFLLSQVMGDGGFNCNSNRGGARHSSLHSTISVLEGLGEYRKRGYAYRLPEVRAAEAGGREFILRHRLYRSDRTGAVIHRQFLQLNHPPRWHYDILRALDYFRDAGVPYDRRMADALGELQRKRRPDGRWLLPAGPRGQVHFAMEDAGRPSRWNTLRALRVLQRYAPGL